MGNYHSLSEFSTTPSSMLFTKYILDSYESSSYCPSCSSTSSTPRLPLLLFSLCFCCLDGPFFTATLLVVEQ
jgi:hypothetical protein